MRVRIQNPNAILFQNQLGTLAVVLGTGELTANQEIHRINAMRFGQDVDALAGSPQHPVARSFGAWMRWPLTVTASVSRSPAIRQQLPRSGHGNQGSVGFAIDNDFWPIQAPA